MTSDSKRATASDFSRTMAGGHRDVVALARLLIVVTIIAILWVAKDILIPISLAVLVAFVLLPIAQWIERRGAPRWISAVLSVSLASVLVVACGWIISTQVMSFAEALPQYRAGIRAKLTTLSGETDSWLSRARRSVTAVQKQVEDAAETLNGEAEPVAPPTILAPIHPPRAAADAEPIPVLAYEPISPIGRLSTTIATITTPLLSATIVLLFTTFILARREDLRDRVLALAGPDRIHTTTDMMDEAAAQLSRLLLAQLLVNIGFAVAFGAVLLAVGVPNAILFGASIIFLRFIPIIGAWISVLLPVLVATLTLEGWTAPVIIVIAFAILEVVVAYGVEPWALGKRTGMSMTAVLFSIAFWTWLWGPPGLVLAMPLTTSLAVMGRRLRSLGWVAKLLNEDPGLPASTRVYQRLLSLDLDAALAVARAESAEHGLEHAYGTVVLPALSRLARDRAVGELADDRSAFTIAGIGDIIDGLADEALSRTPPPHRVTPMVVACVAARSDIDAIVARAVARSLQARGHTPLLFSSEMLTNERAAQAMESNATAICICATPPLAARHARLLVDRLQSLSSISTAPMRTAVLLLHTDDSEGAAQLAAHAQVNVVALSFDEALRAIAD